jgi:hypothetical protein
MGRLRVDAAGIAWQLALGGVFFLLGSWLGTAVLFGAGLSALVAILWSLLPFLRTDGYWFLCDVLNLRDLESPLDEKPRSQFGPLITRNHRRRLAMLLIVYRLGHILFLLLVSFWLPWRLAGWISSSAVFSYDSPVVRGAVTVFIFTAAALLIWMWISIVNRIRKLLAANRSDWRVTCS